MELVGNGAIFREEEWFIDDWYTKERERKKSLRISLFTWNDMEVQKIKKEYLNKKKGAQEKVKQKTLMNKSWKTFEESKWEN